MNISAPQDFKVVALMGVVQGVTPIIISAHAGSIQTVNVPVTIGFNNLLQPFAAAAESWEIVSSSAADTAAGTGARTVLVEYLDATFTTRYVTVALNGLTAVPLAANCFRHQSSKTQTAGSGRVNAGLILIRVAGGGASRGLIDALHSASKQASFTVPANFTGYIQSTQFVVSKANGPGVTCTISFVTRSPNGVDTIELKGVIGEPGVDLNIPTGIPIYEKTTIEYIVTSVSANDVDVLALTGVLLLNLSQLKWPIT